MTITAQTSKTGPYSGNGTTTVFSYTFEVQDEAHLVVTLADAAGVETVQVLNTDYTVSGVGNANGGQITMTTAPASTYTLTISRNVPITQEVDLENRRSVAPEVLEDAYDKLTQIAQDLNEQVGRAIKTSISTASPADLPSSARAGKFLAFDVAGDPIYASGSGSDAALRADLAAAGADTGAALVAYTAGTVATARTVQSRLRDFVSVKDFGAVGDGVTDDTAAIQAAIDEAESRVGTTGLTDVVAASVVVDFVGGLYGISDTLIISKQITLQNGALVALSTPTTTNFMIKIASTARRAVISNLDLDGGLSGTTRYADLIEVNAERVIIQDLLGIHFPNYGIRYVEGQESKTKSVVLREWQFDEAGTTDDTLRTAKAFSAEDADMMFIGCVAAQSLYPFYVSGTLCQFVGCHAYNGGDSTPTVEATTVYLDNTDNCMFTGCYFDNGNLYIKDSFNHCISGCHFQKTAAGSNDSGIFLDTSATNETAEGLTVTGCTFNGSMPSGQLEFGGSGTWISDIFKEISWVGNQRTDGNPAWYEAKFGPWGYLDFGSLTVQPTGSEFNLRGTKSLRLSADYDANSTASESKVIFATDNVDKFEVTAAGQLNKPGTTCGLSVGSGAPTATLDNGSIYLRTDGSGTNDNLYVRRGGAWVGIA